MDEIYLIILKIYGVVVISNIAAILILVLIHLFYEWRAKKKFDDEEGSDEF